MPSFASFCRPSSVLPVRLFFCFDAAVHHLAAPLHSHGANPRLGQRQQLRFHVCALSLAGAVQRCVVYRVSRLMHLPAERSEEYVVGTITPDYP